MGRLPVWPIRLMDYTRSYFICELQKSSGANSKNDPAGGSDEILLVIEYASRICSTVCEARRTPVQDQGGFGGVCIKIRLRVVYYSVLCNVIWL